MTLAAFYVCVVAMIVGSLLCVLCSQMRAALGWFSMTVVSGVGLLLVLGISAWVIVAMLAYLGAVISLILYTVKLLDLPDDDAAFSQSWTFRGAAGTALCVILFAGIYVLRPRAVDVTSDLTRPTETFGQWLFGSHIVLLASMGLLLAAAFTGAAMLTLRHRASARRPETLIEMLRDPQKDRQVQNRKSGEVA